MPSATAFIVRQIWIALNRFDFPLKLGDMFYSHYSVSINVGSISLGILFRVFIFPCDYTAHSSGRRIATLSSGVMSLIDFI